MPEKTTTAASLGTSGGALIVGTLTVNELAAWVGIACAVLTFVINAVFQWRRDRRETRLLAAELHE